MQSFNLPEPPAALLDDASLLIDFDGTLVELADRPDAVQVDAALGRLLARLKVRLNERIGIVSGRSVSQIDAFLPDALDGIAVIGSHGAEIREAGRPVVCPERPAILMEAEQAFHERFGATPGVVIEVKSLGVAIHYRLAPGIEAEANAAVATFAERHGLAAQQGKMMSELRLAGHDKGSAVMALTQNAPFAGHRPIFAGDDLTDESAFVACAQTGGGGILIGPARATAAKWRIADVPRFRGWLENAA
jgi:trehalose 6-phosphate phosphatase